MKTTTTTAWLCCVWIVATSTPIPVASFSFGDIFKPVEKVANTAVSTVSSAVVKPVVTTANTATNAVVGVATNKQVLGGIEGGAEGVAEGALQGAMTGNPAAIILGAGMGGAEGGMSGAGVLPMGGSPQQQQQQMSPQQQQQMMMMERERMMQQEEMMQQMSPQQREMMMQQMSPQQREMMMQQEQMGGNANGAATPFPNPNGCYLIRHVLDGKLFSRCQNCVNGIVDSVVDKDDQPGGGFDKWCVHVNPDHSFTLSPSDERNKKLNVRPTPFKPNGPAHALSIDPGNDSPLNTWIAQQTPYGWQFGVKGLPGFVLGVCTTCNWPTSQGKWNVDALMPAAQIDATNPRETLFVVQAA